MAREIGKRMIGGNLFYLSGRGTQQSCRDQVESLKRQWTYVRVLPYGWRNYGKDVDDYGLWVSCRLPQPK